MKKNKKSYSEAFLGYLYDLNTESKELLGFEEISKIFLSVLDDYFNKIVDTHTLSSVATALYYDFNKPSSFDNNPSMSTLGNLLSSASDLEWLSKNKSEKEMDEVLTKLKEYYKHSKS